MTCLGSPAVYGQSQGSIPDLSGSAAPTVTGENFNRNSATVFSLAHCLKTAEDLRQSPPSEKLFNCLSPRQVISDHFNWFQDPEQPSKYVRTNLFLSSTLSLSSGQMLMENKWSVWRSGYNLKASTRFPFFSDTNQGSRGPNADQMRKQESGGHGQSCLPSPVQLG